MNIRVLGSGPTDPFLSAADLFETEYDLDRPVRVEIRTDPDERTWAAHYDDHHVLNISRQAATSAMARELALHELSHMARNEEGHASHTQSTEEALFLALAGRSVERRKLTHCYQIANHMKDIYADDLTLSVAPAEKLVQFLESRLAASLADRAPTDAPPDARLLTRATDPDIAAVNAAFALALVERHDLVADDHRLYDLAAAAADDAPAVAFDAFKRRFRSLVANPSESDYRKTLVDVTREYAGGADGAQAAPPAPRPPPPWGSSCRGGAPRAPPARRPPTETDATPSFRAANATERANARSNRDGPRPRCHPASPPPPAGVTPPDRERRDVKGRVPSRLRPLVGRDVAVTLGVVAGLYALARLVPVRPLALPGYLLIVGYDVIEAVVPPLTDYYAVGFSLYCYLLAVVAAGVARRLRARGAPAGWRSGAAAALLVLGALSFALAVGVYAPAVGRGGGAGATEWAWTPVLLVAGSGAALCGLGAYLAGYRVRLVQVRDG